MPQAHAELLQKTATKEVTKAQEQERQEQILRTQTHYTAQEELLKKVASKDATKVQSSILTPDIFLIYSALRHWQTRERGHRL